MAYAVSDLLVSYYYQTHTVNIKPIRWRFMKHTSKLASHQLKLKFQVETLFTEILTIRGRGKKHIHGFFKNKSTFWFWVSQISVLAVHTVIKPLLSFLKLWVGLSWSSKSWLLVCQLQQLSLPSVKWAGFGTYMWCHDCSWPLLKRVVLNQLMPAFIWNAWIHYAHKSRT